MAVLPVAYYSQRAYTCHMIEWRRCLVCEVCGFAWLKQGEQLPDNCASQKCRSRKWNASARAQVQPSAVEQGQEANPAPVILPCPTQPRRSAGKRQRKASASADPSRSGGQVSPVRSGQVEIVSPSGAGNPARFAQLVEQLGAPHKFGERCPHGWANWLTCSDCNPARR
jgi:hypothetical protein